jgi:hypothetical protein
MYFHTEQDKVGSLTLEEYKEGAMKNPDIIQGLGIFVGK